MLLLRPHSIVYIHWKYLNSEDDRRHEVLRGLDEGGGGVQGGDDDLALLEADLGLDPAADVELVAVERHPLQVGQEVLPGFDNDYDYDNDDYAC